MTTWWAERAIIGREVCERVVIEERDGLIASVLVGAETPWHARILDGVVLPGAVNAHSHAFHRVLRSRTHRGRDSFWAWRERMYAAAARLDPESYRSLARAVFAELLLGGYTAVG
jgi:cytosine/adenosine deaminase-related metal-dependent hydrolase